MRVKRALVKELAARYQRGTKREKSRVLEEFRRVYWSYRV